MKKLLIYFFLLSGLALYSQDTLKVMHYNLLMYGNNIYGCNSTNNNIDDKNEYLKTIINYVKPDIFTVNEISKISTYQQYILNSVLNINGINYYQMGAPPNYSGSYIINQIYYNSEKLTMCSNIAISTNYRDIDIFRLYYNSPDLKYTNDTIYLNCVVAHLKAGTSYEDEVERANETNKLMNYLSNSNAAGNYLMLGDFNVYTSAEQSFQNLILHQNHDIRFYDPINSLGAWNNNSYFASVHTQSTHTLSGCPSGGGMDDRFDFILVSDEILNGTEKIKSLNESYKAVGQDGQHYNQSLISSPQNTSVPGNVLDALYDMSDHLPVVMELLVGDNVGGIAESENISFYINFTNPVTDKLFLKIETENNAEYKIRINSVWGQRIYSEIISSPGSKTYEIPFEHFKPGIYILLISDKDQNQIVRKIMKI